MLLFIWLAWGSVYDVFWREGVLVKYSMSMILIIYHTSIAIVERIYLWFKMTFWFPSWRSLNLWKGHLNIPKRSQRIARSQDDNVASFFLWPCFVFNGFLFLLGPVRAHWVHVKKDVIGSWQWINLIKCEVDGFLDVEEPVTFHFFWVTLQETNLSRGPPSEATFTWENRAPKDWKVAFVPWWCI